jgi:hypothetical protein
MSKEVRGMKGPRTFEHKYTQLHTITHTSCTSRGIGWHMYCGVVGTELVPINNTLSLLCVCAASALKLDVRHVV